MALNPLAAALIQRKWNCPSQFVKYAVFPDIPPALVATTLQAILAAQMALTLKESCH